MSEFTREDNELFNLLYQIDVKDVTEKRNGLTYLSWAWAWAEISKRVGEVDYSIYKDKLTNQPYVFDEKTGYMVFTSVKINGVIREMWLPVMDSSNKAMKDKAYTYKVKEYKNSKWTGGYIDKTCEAATMFDVNKTIMRCLVKNLAMFGLGLYIFTGEDMPEDVSMLESASDRSKQLFLKTMQKIADEYDKDLDWMILQLSETAKIPADDSKWTKGDLGMLKRGVGWLKQQLEDASKNKQEK
ncbi:DUF1071 domain-containing protein [Enterococcus raffinosus]|uniref:DUF1071 domain-containing protein n=1 Tax=Enterococcus raffinosus TaxID=71452 RepID=A0AAW8THD7_9ENTE|nr:DUF1071 domain-containing protein [Enterococcus raffinosus]MDT2546150.1 DUF1071 domain-containing protein [Enterococcus raffinosus]